MSLSLILALSSVTAIFAAAFLAYQDGMLFPSQMMERYPVGFPFIANGGMWGDLLFVTPALYFIGKHANEWDSEEVWLALLAGLATSLAMHYFVYLKGALPDSLAGGGRPISPAGWIHVGYFAIAIALIGLFYFCSAPTRSDVMVVGILLTLHIVVANHVPFHYLSEIYHFSWCPTIFGNESQPLWILGIAMALLASVSAIKLW